MANLTNQFISASFDGLLQIDSNVVQNGLGVVPNIFILTNVTASTLSVTGSVTSNLIPASNNTVNLGSTTKAWANVYATSISGTFTGDGSSLSGITASASPAGPATSVQFKDGGSTSGSSDFTFDKATGGVTATSFTGSFSGSGANITGVVSASYATTASYALNSTTLPAGLLSGSAQIASDISGSFTSTSASIATNIATNLSSINTLNTKTLISSSAQIASDISGSFTATSASIATNIATNLSSINTLNSKTLLSGSAQIASDISGSFTAASSSFSTRVTTNATNITNLQTDSGSFSTRVTTLETASGSFSTRVTANEGSFAAINNVTGSYATTGSNTFTATQTIQGGLTVSGSLVDLSLTTGISGSEFSGSFRGDGSGLTGVLTNWNGILNGNAIITGSLTVSSSVVDFTNTTAISGSTFSGSFVGNGSGLTGVTAEWDGSRNGDSRITGSFYVSGSSGAVVDFTGVDAISGSTFSGSFAGSGNNLTFTTSTQIFSGSAFSGSFSGDGSGLSNVSAGAGGSNKSFQFNDSNTISGSTSLQYEKTTDVVRATNIFEVSGSTNLSGSTTLIGTTTIKGASGQSAGIYIDDNSAGSVANTLTNGNNAVFINANAGTMGALVNNSVVLGGNRNETFLRDNTAYATFLDVTNVTGSSFTGSFVGDGKKLTNVTASSVSAGLQGITENGSTTTINTYFSGALSASQAQLQFLSDKEIPFATDSNGGLGSDSGFNYNDATTTLTVPTINITNDTTIGSSNSDTVTFNADVDSNIIPDGDNTRQIGEAANRWQLYGVGSSISGSFSGSFYGDGSGLTGIVGGLWTGSNGTITRDSDVQITGSLVVTQKVIANIISGSEVSASTYYGDGSNLTGIVSGYWTGSNGTITRDSDVQITGSLSIDGDVNIGGSTTIEALYRNGTITSTLANVTQSVVQFSTSSYDGAFFDYTATSASNARAGSIIAVWNGGSLNFTETSTTDIGDTTGVSMNVAISQSQATLQSTTTTANWSIKTTTRAI